MRIVLIVVTAVLLLMPSTSYAQAAQASVSPAQESYVVRANAETAVVIRLENATDVYAVDVRVSYDPALIEVIDVDSSQDGIQIEAGQIPQPDLVLRQDADPGAGTVRYVVSQLNPTPAANGSGVLFTIFVRGLGGASSGELRLDSVEMSDRNGNLLPVEWEGATLQVEGGADAEESAGSTAVVVDSTSLPSSGAAVTSSSSATAVTVSSATPPASTSQPLRTTTQAPEEDVLPTAEAATVTEALPPTAVADNGVDVAIQPTRAVDEAMQSEALLPDATTEGNVERAVEITPQTVGGTVAPAETTAVESDSTAQANPPSANATAKVIGSDVGSAGEAAGNQEAELAVVGQEHTAGNVAGSATSGSAPEAESPLLLIALALGLVLLVTVGAILFLRRSG